MTISISCRTPWTFLQTRWGFCGSTITRRSGSSSAIRWVTWLMPSKHDCKCTIACPSDLLEIKIFSQNWRKDWKKKLSASRWGQNVTLIHNNLLTLYWCKLFIYEAEYELKWCLDNISLGTLQRLSPLAHYTVCVAFVYVVTFTTLISKGKEEYWWYYGRRNIVYNEYCYTPHNQIISTGLSGLE